MKVKLTPKSTPFACRMPLHTRTHGHLHWEQRWRSTNEDSWLGSEKKKKKKGALVVEIIFGHLLPEIVQPGTGVDLFPYRLYIVDLAFEGRADEGGRRVVSVEPSSGRWSGDVGSGGRLAGNVWSIGVARGRRGFSAICLCG